MVFTNPSQASRWDNQVFSVRWINTGPRLAFDKIREFSRHRLIATLMMYVDEHDREQTQRTGGFGGGTRHRDAKSGTNLDGAVCSPA